MEEAEKSDGLTGRERVRQVLLQPLENAGCRRRGRMTVADHAAMKERLAAELSHMDADKLAGVRDLAFRWLDGPAGLSWPPEALLRKWALRLQPKPPRSCPYVNSLLASEMGQCARREGFLVELYALALRLGPPPGRYDLDRLRRRADENRRECERIERRVASGAGAEADIEWLAGYRRAESEALRLVCGSA